jgi:hypothetical protein
LRLIQHFHLGSGKGCISLHRVYQIYIEYVKECAEYANNMQEYFIIYGSMTIWQYAIFTHKPFTYAEYAIKYVEYYALAENVK